MKKGLVILLVLGILAFGGTQLVFATDNVVNGGERACFLDQLTDETREKVEAVISDFHANMTVLREKLTIAREKGDREARDEVKDEMLILREQRQQDILPLLPEDVQEEFESRGFGHQQKERPKERPERPEQHRGGFNRDGEKGFMRYDA